MYAQQTKLQKNKLFRNRGENDTLRRPHEQTGNGNREASFRLSFLLFLRKRYSKSAVPSTPPPPPSFVPLPLPSSLPLTDVVFITPLPY